jgi:hypothetical protein
MHEGDPEAGPWIDLEAAYRWLEPRLVTHHGKDRRPYQQPTGGSGTVVLGRNVAYSGLR